MIDQSQSPLKQNELNPWALLEEHKLSRHRRLVKPHIFHYSTEAPIDFVPIGTALVLRARQVSTLEDVSTNLGCNFFSICL